MDLAEAANANLILMHKASCAAKVAKNEQENKRAQIEAAVASLFNADASDATAYERCVDRLMQLTERK